jgi:UDP-N-acetylglucosamine acyltransferase
MTTIHHTAIVSQEAFLGRDVFIGPYCIVGAGVHLHEGVRLLSHVVVEGDTVVGSHTVVYPFATIGQDPQHLAYEKEPTKLVIGTHNQIREHVTIHKGTIQGGGLTQVGSHCLLMVGCHVAHDCLLGNHVVMANSVNLGGHVIIQDHAVLGGMTGIHQFTRIGEGAMVGGFSAVGRDIIPYGIVIGNRGGLFTINVRKLKRLGVSHEEIHGIRAVYEWLFDDKQKSKNNLGDTLFQRAQNIPEHLLSFQRVKAIQAFILADAKRPLCTPQPTGESMGKGSWQTAGDLPL